MSLSPRLLANRLATARAARSVCGAFATRWPTRLGGRRRQLFHSHEHPAGSAADPAASPAGLHAAEHALLAAAYARVPEHGFTAAALAAGACDAGYPDISASLLPDGVFGLIRHHLTTRRRDLADRSGAILAAPRIEGPRASSSRWMYVADKIERLSWARLMGNKDVIHKWQEALAVMAQPSYAQTAVKELAALTDDIWYLADDTAVDMSWYTKRAALSAIYASSELFMTNDRSADFRDTRQFLRRRLNEAQGIGGFAESLGQWIGFTAASGVNVLRSKGVRI